MNAYQKALTMIIELEDTVAELLEALEEIQFIALTSYTAWEIADKAIRKAKGE